MTTFTRRLYYDPVRHIDVQCHMTEDDELIISHTHTAWRDVVEFNKEYIKENPRNVHAGNTQKHMVKIGEIPLQIWMDLKERGIADDPQALKKWLMDRDNSHFRTYDGRV